MCWHSAWLVQRRNTQCFVANKCSWSYDSRNTPTFPLPWLLVVESCLRDMWFFCAILSCLVAVIAGRFCGWQACFKICWRCQMMHLYLWSVFADLDHLLLFFRGTWRVPIITLKVIIESLLHRFWNLDCRQRVIFLTLQGAIIIQWCCHPFLVIKCMNQKPIKINKQPQLRNMSPWFQIRHMKTDLTCYVKFWRKTTKFDVRDASTQ